MSREILFRGKDTIYQEWIYGDLLTRANYAQIWQDSDSGKFPASVIPETVSEYIGLTDKNGRKIFEHDLLKDEFGFIHEVYFDDGCFMRKLGLKSTLLATTHQVFEVVGNTFDNPELLKINNKLWSESV